MKLYAHRGWAVGGGENTLAVFRRAVAAGSLDGVEFDIRTDGSGTLIVQHDPVRPHDDPPTLEAVLDIIEPSPLELFAEIKQSGIGAAVIDTLTARGLADRSVVFGFPQSAASLPWDEPRSVRLGLITHLPWQADGLAARYRPDILMAGWDRRPWTRHVFKSWWTVRSFRKLANRHGARTAGGIVRRAQDFHWLAGKGFDIATVDLHQNGERRLADGTPLENLRQNRS